MNERVPPMHLVRELAKSSLAHAFHGTRALPLLATARRTLRGPRVHILAFHRIVDDLERLPAGVIRSLCTTTATFTSLCRLAKQHFEVLPLVEAARVVAGERPAPRRDVLAITFDDGYRDVYLRALPVLQELGLPATAFIPTGLIGSSQLLEHDRLFALLALAQRHGLPAMRQRASCSFGPTLTRVESILRRGHAGAVNDALELLINTVPARTLEAIGDYLEERLGQSPALDGGSYVMSEHELRACAAGGIELGAHTVGHIALVHESAARVREELERPRAELAAIAGRPCVSFAYCNGLWHAPLLDAVKAAGYRVAVTTRDEPNVPGGDLLRLGRKSLWEGHALGIDGRYSEARAMAHLFHLYGDLALQRPVDGRAPEARTASPAVTNELTDEAKGAHAWPLRA